MKDENQYEKIDIKSDLVFSFDDVTKTFLLKVVGKRKIDNLYLKMNEQGSGAHKVNIHPIFSLINRINKILSFQKFDFEKLFDLKDYDK